MSFKRGSRYINVRYFSKSDINGAAFRGTRERQIKRAEGVVEHTIELGQRLDLLALHYYNDDKKWWRILDANPHILNAGDLVIDEFEGETIVIPRS